MQLENMTKAEFRLDLADLPLLVEVLGIKNKTVCAIERLPLEWRLYALR